MTCIGWPAPDGCPHWGGDFHGCRLGDHRSRIHVCECGATTDDQPKKDPT